MKSPKEKKERTLGVHLHVKGERCLGPKCALSRRPNRPGVHGARRARALSDFGRQIREKQKFKISYGLDERNLRHIYNQAARSASDVASRLMELLERRLDNAVFRLGFTSSRSSARTLIVQGHIMVNGRKIRSPGYLVKPKDALSIRSQSLQKTLFKELKEKLKKQDVPSWLAMDPEKIEGKVLSVPSEFEYPFEINLLVESFNK